MDSGSSQNGIMGRLRGRASLFSAVVVVGGTILAACGGGSTGGGGGTGGIAAKLSMSTQPPASIATRATLSPAPVVQVLDANGAVVDTAGIQVTASVNTGGGTLVGTTTVATNANGLATFSNLNIQGTVGSRTLRFAATGLSAINTTTLQLTAGPAVNLVANSATNQNGVVSTAVSTKPAVKAADIDGNGVSGVSITFAVTGGGGSLTGGTTTTNASGAATVGSWTLGSSIGLNTMTATSAGLTGSPVTFNATAGAVVSNFTINIQYTSNTTATANQQAAFTLAAARWSEIITGDLGTVNVSNLDMSVCGAPAGTVVNGAVNDVTIVAELKAFDGAGGVLGAATPCYIRSGSSLTLTGYMFFDTADLANLEAAGQLNDVILHEMGHVLGFGTYWENWPTNGSTFLTTSGTINGSTLGFTGANAIAAFTTSAGSGGAGGGGTAVPVEDTTVTGTGRAHWREPVFRSELMTGYLSGTVHPLSQVTVQSLKDLGYVVNVAAADAFSLATQPTLRADGTAPPVVHLDNDVIPFRPRKVDVRTGQVLKN